MSMAIRKCVNSKAKWYFKLIKWNFFKYESNKMDLFTHRRMKLPKRRKKRTTTMMKAKRTMKKKTRMKENRSFGIEILEFRLRQG